MSETASVVELQKRVNDQVVNYYSVTQELYNKYYMTKDHRAMHHGYWDADILSNFNLLLVSLFPFATTMLKSHEESLARMDEVCAKLAEIKETDLVLDAGCGVGGSSIWIAKNIGARVIGITLVPMQVELAKKFAMEKGVDHLVSFKVMDFTTTEFNDETFDVVWAIESACHAVDKRLFLAESHRILKKGGRLMVSDGFLKNDENKLTASEMRDMREWTSGFAVPNLATIDQFRKYLLELGFDNITFRDITENVLPTARLTNSLGRSYLQAWRWVLSWWWIPTAKLIDTLRVKTSNEGTQLGFLSRSRIKLAHANAEITHHKCLEEGIWGYVTFCAKKR